MLVVVLAIAMIIVLDIKLDAGLINKIMVFITTSTKFSLDLFSASLSLSL